MSNAGDSQRLLSFVERIERLTDERSALSEDIKAVKAEAKSQGYDTGVLNEVIKRRAMDAAERCERDDLRDQYEQLLGMLD